MMHIAYPHNYFPKIYKSPYFLNIYNSPYLRLGLDLIYVLKFNLGFLAFPILTTMHFMHHASHVVYWTPLAATGVNPEGCGSRPPNFGMDVVGESWGLSEIFIAYNVYRNMI